MAELPSYFTDFLSRIRLTDEEVKELIDAHTTLRERLDDDGKLSPIIVSTFLQGSYRRATIVKPEEGGKADVDVVVVTKMKREDYPDPHDALREFEDFLEEHYSGQYEYQGRSIGISLDHVDLDLVVTSAPSEAAQKALLSQSVRAVDTVEEAPDWRLNEYWIENARRASMLGLPSWLRKAAESPEWKTEPLWIPDREAGVWEQTNPLEQIRWTHEKNRNTGSHFVNVVKALKWWRRVRHPIPERPKSYPLEHIIGDCCKDGISSVAEGIVVTLEEILGRYQSEAASQTTPESPDRGVDENVLKRVPGEDFAEFHEQASAAADLARDAFEEEDIAESARKWGKLLGDEFPESPKNQGSGGGGSVLVGGFSERRRPTTPSGGRFA